MEIKTISADNLPSEKRLQIYTVVVLPTLVINDGNKYYLQIIP